MSNLLASIPKIPSAHYGIKSNRAFSSQQQLRQSTIHPHILLAWVYFFVALNSEMQSILIQTRYLTSFYLELICFVKETRFERMIYGFQSWCPIPLPRSLKSMGSWLKVTIAPLPRAKKKLAVLRLWGAIYEETQFWPHNSKLLKNGLVPLILLGAFLRHESSFVSSTGHQVFEGLNYKSSSFLVNAFFSSKVALTSIARWAVFWCLVTARHCRLSNLGKLET